MALLPVTDALERILAQANPLPAENAALAEAHGRVLVQDLAARRTQPPADMSAMDGYAVRAKDVENAPTTLKVIGEVPAGRPFTGRVHEGEAARIFTGGMLPDGADTVVIQEQTERSGDNVTVTKASPAGKHIRRRGLDFSTGDVIFRAGHRLTDRDLSLIAAMNHADVPVHRRPRVAIVATGDELVPPGTEPQPGQIVYSNGYALAALARAEGAEVTNLGIVADRIDDTVAAIRRARDLDADVLVTTGGASVGEYDLVQKALSAEGLQLSFWKIGMRPGRPMLHGKLAGMNVLGLPGNPVSSYVCAFLFLVPLLRKLSGRSDVTHALETAVLGADLPANDERADYMRATLSRKDQELIATPFSTQDSSMMQALARADALIVRAPFAPSVKADETCSVLRLPF